MDSLHQRPHEGMRLPYTGLRGELISLPEPLNLLANFSLEIDFDDFIEEEDL